MTNVPIPTLGPTGFVIPAEAAIQAGAQADINAALGGGVNPGLSTAQGQLASSLAAIIADCNAQFLAIVSGVDPKYAQGRMQDAIGNIYFMTRFPATATQVSGICNGLAGTVIPAGVPVASDASGNLYTCAGGTIPASGILPMTFANQARGPVNYTGPLAIYQTTPGWDSITGSLLVALGRNVESAQQFEARRSASVAVNANGSLASIRAAVLASGANLTPPTPPASVYLVDNPVNTAVTLGGISIPGNSIYIAVVGGNPAAIAQAIWTKKDLGCSYAPSAAFTASIAGTLMTVTAISSGVLAVGQTVSGAGISSGITISSLGTGSGGLGTYNLSATVGTVSSEGMTAANTVYVQDTSYLPPYPTYAVSYTVPVNVPINIAVTLAQASNPPANALAILSDPAAGLVTAFNGNDGGTPAAQIGATVYSSRFFQTINQLLPGVNILNVLVGSGSPTLNAQALNINQYPVIGNITVAFA